MQRLVYSNLTINCTVNLSARKRTSTAGLKGFKFTIWPVEFLAAQQSERKIARCMKCEVYYLIVKINKEHLTRHVRRTAGDRCQRGRKRWECRRGKPALNLFDLNLTMLNTIKLHGSTFIHLDFHRKMFPLHVQGFTSCWLRCGRYMGVYRANDKQCNFRRRGRQEKVNEREENGESNGLRQKSRCEREENNNRTMLCKNIELMLCNFKGIWRKLIFDSQS